MFTCHTCGKQFEIRREILDRYPGWAPRQCLECRGGPAVTRATTRTKRQDLSTGEVLAAFADGPTTGVFTDGASEGNPGPGGWGAVYVVDDEIVAEAHGAEPWTTNNRMELTALIAGLRMLPTDARITVFTDSELVVNILTKWADGWQARGWRKKSAGPIANLELVKEAHALYQERPWVELTWIKAHSGFRWNEYADALATSYRREVH